MTTIKTFRTDGELAYDDIDDNWDNLNNDKIERVVTVNDANPAINITQAGTGDLIKSGTDFVVQKGGRIGIGVANPTYSLHIEKTGAVKLPVGTTDQRSSPEKGTLRYNQTVDQLEYGTGTRWKFVDQTKLNIDKITTGGYNGIQVFGEGEIYFASGSNGQWAVMTNGVRNNFVDRYGLGEFTKIILPPAADGLKIVDAGSLSHYSLSFALLENGDLYAWGNNDSGQSGNGVAGVIHQPTLVQQNVSKVFPTIAANGSYGVGSGKMVIQKTDGYIYSAGYNAYGQLGDGTTTLQSTFVQIPQFGQNPKSVWNIGNIYGYMFCQRADGRLFACGYNGYGHLGTGTTATSVSTPVDVTANWLNNDTSYVVKYMGGSAGYYISSAVTDHSVLMFADNGTNTLVKTAGNNTNNQLGDGTATQRTTPVTLSFPARVRQALHFGVLSCLVLLENNTLYAWGYNTYGQLGTTPANLTTPTIVQNNVSYIVSQGWDSATHGYWAASYIVKTDGYLYASGFNSHGQCCVGYQGTNVTGYTRCILPNGPGNKIKTIGMLATRGSGTQVLAVREDNEVFGWGYNADSGVYMTVTGTNVISAMNFKIKRT